MEHIFFAIPILGGIGIALFPKPAREVYVALSIYAWVRKLAEDCNDLVYRALGITIAITAALALLASLKSP